MASNASAKFWDKIAARYSKRPVADEGAYQKKLQVTQGYFQPDWNILELGCGTGSTAIVHSPHVKHIRAVDVSSRMLDIARAKASDQGIENIDFECAAIEDLQVVDESLDAVLALSVLHLLADWQSAISAVHRMLKPGGIFVTSTACIGDFMKFFKIVAPIGQLVGLMPLVRVFTSGELEAAVRSAGFVIDYRWQPGRNKALFLVAKKSS